MKLNVHAVNFDATERLEQYIEKKSNKIVKIFDDVMTMDFFLKVVKPETAANKEVEIKVGAPGTDFFASKVCDTFEEAVDLGLEAIEKQVIKYKEKLIKN